MESEREENSKLGEKMSSGKLLGTAVGVALENQEAIRNASAPAMNAAGGVVQIIFRTFWKSIVVGLGLLVVWFAAFAFTYILGGTNFLGNPTFMALFGLFLFLVLPSIICVIEARKVTKSVARKNQAQRVAAQAAREAQQAQHAEAMAYYEAQQQQAVAPPQYQPQR